MSGRTALVSPMSGASAQIGDNVGKQLSRLGYQISESAMQVQAEYDTGFLQDTFNDITTQSKSIYESNKENPTAFEQVFTDYQDKLLEATPNHLKGRVKQELTQKRIGYGDHVAGNFKKKQEEIKFGENWTFNVNMQNEILTSYRNGNVERGQQLLEELKAANGLSGLYTPQKIEEMDFKVQQAARSQLITGTAQRTLKEDGLQGLLIYKQSLEKDETGIFDNPEERDSALSVVDGFISQERSRLKELERQRQAKVKATQKVYKKEIAGLVDVLELGYEVDAVQLDNAASALDVLDLPDDAEKLNLAIVGRDFARLSATERQGVLSDVLEKNPAKYSYLKSIDNKVAKLEQSDPLVHYQNQGKAVVQPVDYRDPQSIMNRNKVVMELEEMTGRSDIPLLTSLEQKQLTDAFGQMNAQEKVAVLGSIVGGLGTDSVNTLNSLSKKGGSMMALGGQLVMDGAPEAAESIFMGQQVMTQMKEIMPKDTDFNLELNTQLGTAYSGNPLQRKTISQAAKAVYADLARRDGDLSGVIDSSRVEEAVNLVTGGLINYESGKWSLGGESSMIEPPVRGMTTDQFEDWIDSLTPSDIDAMGGSNMNSKDVLRLLKDEAQIESVRVENKTYPVYIIKTPSGAIANKDGNGLFYLEYTPK